MTTLTLTVSDEVVSALRSLDDSIERTAAEMLVIELFRRGRISGGKAAELLAMTRLEFIRHADQLGIPYFHLSLDEWESERAFIDAR